MKNNELFITVLLLSSLIADNAEAIVNQALCCDNKKNLITIMDLTISINTLQDCNYDLEFNTFQNTDTIFKKEWECGDSLFDERDSKKYSTVLIGEQCWMAENLNIGNMINANRKPSDNGIIEKYCYINNIDNCNIFGGLYQWDEAMQYKTIEGTQGICPEGWHVPTDKDWCLLTKFIDSKVNCNAGLFIHGSSGTDVGTKMKSASGWITGFNGTNASGFNALPGGYKSGGMIDYSSGKLHFFDFLGRFCFFWSSTINLIKTPDDEVAKYLVWYRRLNKSTEVYRESNPNYIGYNIRCIKDY